MLDDDDVAMHSSTVASDSLEFLLAHLSKACTGANRLVSYRLRYVSSDDENGPSMRCNGGRNEASKPMVWNTIPLRYFARISFVSTSDYIATLMRFKPKP